MSDVLASSAEPATLQNVESLVESSHQQNVASSVESSSADSEGGDDTLSSKLGTLEIREEAPPRYLSTGLIYDKVMTLHKCEWDPNFPENPLRITEPYKRCCELGLIQRCQQIQTRRAKEEEILTKHAKELVQLAETTVSLTYEERMELCKNYDAWYCNDHTYDAALIAAGTTIKMVDDILQNNLTNGFAMVRPPGHHAMENEFNGYCTFNNVALAAQSALDKGVERILIVDWDVHHGQGIQRMFYDDPRVMYCSIHRFEYGRFWPQLRESDYDFIGSGQGAGFNINVPLNQIGMSNSDYMAILNQIILPLAYEFSPQLVLVSSGYDAALGCPEGQMMITPPMYAHMLHHLMALAKGRVCVALEGGYCIKSLSEGCALTLRSLLQDPCPQLPALAEPSDSIITTILNLVKVLHPYCNCFKHFKKLDKFEKCVYSEVNNTPPVPGVVFVTPENKPKTYDLMGFYPVQDLQTRQNFANQIDDVIRETNLSVAGTRCCYTYDSQMRDHKNLFSSSHPERPDRISSIHKKFVQWMLTDRCLMVPSRLAKKSEILWIHTENYLEELQSTESLGENELRDFPSRNGYSSIYLHQKSLYCALLACGSVLNVVEAVLTGQAQSGVAIVRPPGHHAEFNTAMGFCFFNNVAVAAKLAQKKFNVKKVLIVDWDVHHGNATQHQFYRDPSVLYISLHRYDSGSFFPCQSDADMYHTGTGAGEGFNVNIPWSGSKMGDAEYLMAFTQIIMPIAYQFAPDLVLVSAGFDSAVGDPLGGYKVTPAGYAHMTHMLMGLANGRVVLALEGGYNLYSISECMAACTSVLLGDPCPALTKLDSCDSAANIVNNVLLVQKRYWPCLKFKVKIPPGPEVVCREEKLAPASPSTPASNRVFDSGDTTSYETTGAASETTNVSGSDTNITTITSTSHTITSTSHTSSSSSLNYNDSNTHGKEGQGQSDDEVLTSGLQELTLQTTSGVRLAGTSALWRDPAGAYDRVEGSGAPPAAPPASPPAVGVFVTVSEMEASPPVTRFDSSSPRQTREQARTQEKPVPSTSSDREETIDFPEPESLQEIMQDVRAGETRPSGSRDPEGVVAGGGDELLGACGGSSRPSTVAEFLNMPNAPQQMFAVTPLPWCPHLSEVMPLKSDVIDAHEPCNTCGDPTENWLCLTCHRVECSRFVNEHMMLHKMVTDHNMALSFTDLSVWCYTCDQYVDNEILFPVKNAAHLSKFGESLPSIL